VVIDSGGSKTVSSPAQLMTEIVQAPQTRRLYAERFVSYATKRLPNERDACLVDTLTEKLSDDGYLIRTALTDLSQADSFRLRLPAQQ
jgi:hypothetical protein